MRSKYPFADWLDGRVWLLRSNLDFLCLPVSIRGQVATQARKAGLAVTTHLVEGGLLVQSYQAGSTWKPNLPAIPLGRIKKVMANNR